MIINTLKKINIKVIVISCLFITLLFYSKISKAMDSDSPNDSIKTNKNSISNSGNSHFYTEASNTENIVYIRRKTSSFSTVVKNFQTSFSRRKKKFSKRMKSITDTFSSSTEKKSSDKNYNEKYLSKNNSQDGTNSEYISPSSSISSDEDKLSDHEYKTCQEVASEHHPKTASFNEIDNTKNINSSNSCYDLKGKVLIRDENNTLRLIEVCNQNDENAYEFMGGCIHRNNNFFEISCDFTRKFNDDLKSYQGYYTPEHIILMFDDDNQSSTQKSDFIEEDENDYVIIGNSFKNSLELQRMLAYIGAAELGKQEIKRHDYYIRGIHLCINILKKFQIVFPNDDNLCHRIYSYKDYDIEDIDNKIQEFFHENNEDQEYSFISILDHYKDIIIDLLVPIYFLGKENIYGLLSIDIKVETNIYECLKNFNLLLYSFKSHAPEYNKNQFSIKQRKKYQYTNYYIASITIFATGIETNYYYKVKDDKYSFSDFINLFANKDVVRIIHNATVKQQGKFIIVTSILIPYNGIIDESDIQSDIEDEFSQTYYGSSKDVLDNETQFNLSLELDDSYIQNSPKDDVKNNLKDDMKNTLKDNVKNDIENDPDIVYNADDFKIIDVTDFINDILADIDMVEATIPSVILVNIENENCPCGLKNQYENCCGIFHNELNAPDTAEQLMRSRYSAYYVNNMDYIIKTAYPEQQRIIKNNPAFHSQDIVQWLKLEIINIEKGLQTDVEGFVEFRAWYLDIKTAQEKSMHERSYFVKQDGTWYYVYKKL